MVLPEYRVRDRHGTTPIDAALDARAALRWIAEHSDRLGVDKHNIFAGGGSAGGQLAASLPVTASLDSEAGITPKPKGLVLFNPAANFDHPEGIGRQRHLGDVGVSLEEFLRVDPYIHATGDYPPTLILHGTADRIVPISAIEAFALRLRELAVRVHMVAFEGREHGFFNLVRSKSDFDAALVHIDDFLDGMVAG